MNEKKKGKEEIKNELARELEHAYMSRVTYEQN